MQYNTLDDLEYVYHIVCITIRYIWKIRKMPRVGVTREQVWSAADKIFAEGKVVTQEKVRVELGSGSHSTIGKYLREWKEQSEADSPMKDCPMPEKIRKKYEEISQFHWNNFIYGYEHIIIDERIDGLEKENETLRDKLEIAEQDSIRLEELQKAYYKLLKRYEIVSERVSKAEAEIESLRSHVENLTS